MPEALKLHPDSRCGAVRQIAVDIARPQPERLVLSYVVTGSLSEVRMPPLAAAARRDGLWQHTCFEAFVRAPRDAAYYEFNFAPSTQWAAYRFSGYRSGMRPAEGIDAPRIELQPGPQSCTLRVVLDLNGLPDLAREASLRLGLSALIEDTSGRMSYWALAHPPGKPDFHHADSFVLGFSPAVPS